MGVFQSITPGASYHLHKGSGLALKVLSDARNIKELTLDIPQIGRSDGFPEGTPWEEGAAFTRVYHCLMQLSGLKKFTLRLGRENDHKICRPGLGHGISVVDDFSHTKIVENEPDHQVTGWLDLEESWKRFKVKRRLETEEEILKEVKPTFTFTRTMTLLKPGKVKKLFFLELWTTQAQESFLRSIERGFGFTGKSVVCASYPELPWNQFEFVWEAPPRKFLSWS